MSHKLNSFKRSLLNDSTKLILIYHTVMILSLSYWCKLQEEKKILSKKYLKIREGLRFFKNSRVLHMLKHDLLIKKHLILLAKLLSRVHVYQNECI